ncbi:MAG: AMP-dependent synthetase, partial [Rhodospirillaceae bacterium]|nr:AMP-dependent synthetase [Rhodospirillaceae bacterium]
MNEIVWRADADALAASNIQNFIETLGAADYDDLLVKAADDPDWFWDQTVRYMGFAFERPYDKIRDISDGPAWAKWCVGGTTNATL